MKKSRKKETLDCKTKTADNYIQVTIGTSSGHVATLHFLGRYTTLLVENIQIKRHPVA